jgi:methyl-accepting chemotaxis protein
MNPRKQFRFSLAILVAFQLITAFGAIGLLSRMTPAIAEILDENEYTIEAAHEMLLVLSQRALNPNDATQQQQFRAALERAKDNITEPGEPAVLAQLERDGPRAVSGDPLALRETVDGIRRLVGINREAMLRADHEARRLGSAGAWAAVILAVAALAASILVSRRLAGHILDPLGELYEVTEAARAGDHFRRCRRLSNSGEMSRLLESVNLLLDERVSLASSGAAAADGSRAVALHFLDQRPQPTFVVDEKGEVTMANSAGLDSLSGPNAAALRQQLSAAASSNPVSGLQVAPLPNAGLWLCSAL